MKKNVVVKISGDLFLLCGEFTLEKDVNTHTHTRTEL